MTIRTRLTFWYAAILFVSALLIGGLSYHEISERERKGRVEHESRDGDEDEGESTSTELLEIAASCGIPAALLGLGGGYWLMRKAMQPVTVLTKAAAQVNDSNLHQEIARTRNGDELDQLTAVFNEMTQRLGTSFGRIREFTLHASHELKTPLTVMNAEMETALREETLPAAQRERLLSHIDELQRLTKIVDGLTLLTKADAGQVALNLEPVRFDQLVSDCVEDAQILAQSKKIEVSLCACEPVTIIGDRHRLRQLLLNLTDNAVKYNRDNGTVVLSLKQVDGRAEFMVTNTGKGISPEMLPRVFERFFRCDQSHNSAIEGCGLGLSIAQWIVNAHGGTIQVASDVDQPTTVTVRFPTQSQPSPATK